ncbi:MAG: PQQ-binding-like beta-propeller repeat protein [Planctomycetes bacterium]|nr:PQQ-binding-like beta-propeller repeat protein [Planctomycetota bacterium]
MREVTKASSLRAAALALAAALAPLAAPAQEWSRFRGPNGSGLSAAFSVPTEWTEKDFDWRVPLPGPGISQPVLWGERIFLTAATADGSERMVLCLKAADGAAEWTRRSPSAACPRHQRNTHATSTPAVDAERIYFSFSTPGAYTLGALDHGGRELWKRDLGPYDSQHGDGSSPILVGDLVVLANEQDGASFLVAVDRKTGETRWRTERRSEETAYGTPCVVERGGKPAEIVFSSHAHGLSAVDPLTGALLWEARVFDKRTVSSPVLAGDLVVGTCGSGGGGNFAVAVRLGGKGDVTATHAAWKIAKSMAYVPTPVAKDGLVFFWSDKGIVTCAEAVTGSVLWQERVGGGYSSSPVCIGDRLLCLSEEGEAVVVAASRAHKLLARNPIGEGSRSTPAVAGGRLYVRTYTHLISIGGRR